MSSIKILDFRPLRRNTLLGFCRAEFASGIVISDITILTSARGPWASPPSKPMLNRDGVAMKDDGGKIRYASFIEFKSKEVRDRWSSAVIDALRSSNPEAFDDEH